MKKHIKNYMEHHDYGEQDMIICELCGDIATDVHHIVPKSICANRGITDPDGIKNLIGLCRPCHSEAHGIEVKHGDT